MAETVYVLCALTSIACAVLLLRGYAHARARLLLWSGLCFVFLAVNNALLFVDKVLVPEQDRLFGEVTFATARSVAAVAGLGVLLFGLIWDAE